MSNGETLNNAHKVVGNIVENSSKNNNQQGPQAEAVSPNQQLVDMLRLQNEALRSYMQEIGNLKKGAYTEMHM